MKRVVKKEEKFENWQILGIGLLIFVISGIFGWIYEFIFYYFNDGKFTFQGGNFLPWINIYAYGALLIIITTYKKRKKPFFVFMISVISTGLLEYISGYLVYKLDNGARYWDYNTEILNFGNINGFICFRSVTFFGLSALFLIYVLVPYIVNLSKKIHKKTFLIISIILFTIIMTDEIYNFVAKINNYPRAKTIYKKIGIK